MNDQVAGMMDMFLRVAGLEVLRAGIWGVMLLLVGICVMSYYAVVRGWID